MTQRASKKAGRRTASRAAVLSSREADALRIARELAREARLVPTKPPVDPDRPNRYIAR